MLCDNVRPPLLKALAAYWGGAFVQGLRFHFISMRGKSPMKLEVTSRHDHICLLGRKASKQNKQNIFSMPHYEFVHPQEENTKDCSDKVDGIAALSNSCIGESHNLLHFT